MNSYPKTKHNGTGKSKIYLCQTVFFLTNSLVSFFRDVSEQNCVPLSQIDGQIFLQKSNINSYKIKERKRRVGTDNQQERRKLTSDHMN